MMKFMQKLAVVWAIFSLNFSAKNIFNIIITVPGGVA
jgi:hypothetical protein